MARRKRRLFTVGGGRPAINRPPEAPETIRYKDPPAGGRVGGGSIKKKKMTPDEISKMQKEIAQSNWDKRMKSRTKTKLDAKRANHTNTYNDLADRVDPTYTEGSRDNEVGYVAPPASDTSGKPHTYHEEKITKRSKHPREMGQSRVEHKVRVTTGRPTTRSIWDIVKQNGLTRTVLFDSRFPTTAGAYEYPPVQKDISSGVNQRAFTILSPSTYINMQDIIDVAETSTEYISQPASSQIQYLSLLDTTSEIMIHNQNRFFGAKIKIHLVKHTKESDINNLATIQDYWAASVFNTDISIPEDGKVPLWQQFSVAEVTSSADEAKVSATTSYSVLMSLKGRGLMDSPFFRDHFEIVKTSGATLLAGETLHYRHTHSFGPGFDTAVINDTSDTNIFRRFEPASYFYILEQCGSETVECTYCYDTNKYTSYLAKNYVYLGTEVRKSLRYANTEKAGEDLLIGGVQLSPVHMRVWDSKASILASNAEKEFNLSPANIIATTTATVPGTGNVYVMTDQTFAQSTHGSRENN